LDRRTKFSRHAQGRAAGWEFRYLSRLPSDAEHRVMWNARQRCLPIYLRNEFIEKSYKSSGKQAYFMYDYRYIPGYECALHIICALRMHCRISKFHSTNIVNQ